MTLAFDLPQGLHTDPRVFRIRRKKKRCDRSVKFRHVNAEPSSDEYNVYQPAIYVRYQYENRYRNVIALI